EMIGVVERDEALGMPSCKKNRGRVVDPDGVVARRMEHDQRAAQRGDRRCQLLRGDVVEKFAANVELASGELHLGFTASIDFGTLAGKEMRNMRRIGRRVERRDRNR